MTTLTQERIVEAAIGLVDEHGLDGLTMRALASALDVTATALYYHFESRDTLLEALVAHETERLVTGRSTGGEWEGQLRDLLGSVVDELTRHPGLAVWIMTTQARQAPVLQIHEAVLEILLGGGFDETAAVEAKGLVFRFLIGHLILEAAPDGVSWRELPRRFERLRATGAAHDAVDRSDLFAQGLDAIIQGLSPGRVPA